MLSPRLRYEATLLVATAVLTPAIGGAEPERRPLYQWTAEDGGIRYTPDPSRIPASRRHTQRRIDPPPALVEAPLSPSPPGDQSGPVESPHFPEPIVQPPGPPSAATAAGAEATRRASLGPSSREGRWAIQLLATPLERERAPLPAVSLGAGERLYRTTARIDGALWSRLRVGLFATRAGAEKALERLAPEFPGAWITRVAPVDDLPPVAAGNRNGASPGPTRSDPVAPRLRRDGAASEVDGTPAYAIQLQAIPASQAPGPLPVLARPPGSQLYWTSFERDGQSWRRLRLGDFRTLAAARAGLALVARDFPGAWIAPIRGPRDRLDAGQVDPSQ